MRFTRPNLEWQQWPKQIFLFWLRHHKLLFFGLLLSTVALGGFEWYRNLFGYSWTAEERKAYLETAVKETSFDENKFNRALQSVDAKRDSQSKSISVRPGLFVHIDKEQ